MMEFRRGGETFLKKLIKKLKEGLWSWIPHMCQTRRAAWGSLDQRGARVRETGGRGSGWTGVGWPGDLREALPRRQTARAPAMLPPPALQPPGEKAPSWAGMLAGAHPLLGPHCGLNIPASVSSHETSSGASHPRRLLQMCPGRLQDLGPVIPSPSLTSF